jgi:hypothetical protein
MSPWWLVVRVVAICLIWLLIELMALRLEQGVT